MSDADENVNNTFDDSCEFSFDCDDFTSSFNVSSDSRLVISGSEQGSQPQSQDIQSHLKGKSTNSSTPRKRKQAAAAAPPTPDFVCLRCKRHYKTRHGLSAHMQDHALQDAAARRPSVESLRSNSLENARKVVQEMESAPVADTSKGRTFVQYLKTVQSMAKPDELNENFICFVLTVVSIIEPLLCSSTVKKDLLPSRIRTNIRQALIFGLADEDVRNRWLKELSTVTDTVADLPAAVLFLQEFIRRFSSATAAFIVRTMQNHPNDQHIKESNKFSKDDYDKLFNQQTLHNVAGSAVRGLLRKCRQYRHSSKWQRYQQVLLERFARIGTCVAVPQNTNFWTATLGRQRYTFVHDEPLKFFIEVAKIICYSETDKGCIERNQILKAIFGSPSLLSLWDSIVGGSLSENESFELMKILSLALSGTFGKGILLRRMNQLSTKSGNVVSVGIRAKLVHT